MTQLLDAARATPPLPSAPSSRAALTERLDDMASLIGRLAHDFGNVLTGVMGFTELALLQMPPDSLGFQRVQEAYRAAELGAQFVQRLNLISQRVPRGIQSVRLQDVVSSQAALQVELSGGSLIVTVTVPADLPAVALDAACVREILAALLDNARQAVTAGGTVTISASRATDAQAAHSDWLGVLAPGPAVVLTVADTGVGFTPEAQQRVFVEPFYSSRPRHRGMGLATVYGLLRAHGGGLRLEHGARGGTRVDVYLPAVVVAHS